MFRDEFVAAHRSAWTELDSLLSRSSPLGGHMPRSMVTAVGAGKWAGAS